MGDDIKTRGTSDAERDGGFTDRQRREIEYYEKYVGGLAFSEVSFDPVESNRGRPWNPYWYVYGFAREQARKGKARLLDFGCGCGTTSVRFAKLGYEVDGFDISDSSLRIANNLAERYGFDTQISLTRQTAESLDYPAEHFDIIVGFDILHHVDINLAISECHRVLKKGGVAIFKEPVEAYLLDRVRNTRVVSFFFPSEVNFTPGRHITKDERKLKQDDISIFRRYFSNISERRFTLLSRLDVLFRRFYGKRSSPLEIVDYCLLKIVPPLRVFGGDAVFVFTKEGDPSDQPDYSSKGRTVKGNTTL